MNFCPKCEYMLFTKTKKDDTSKNVLINYCKNCFWSGIYIADETTDKISVYKKKYTDDYISHSIYTNPHIIHDHTLPRINNIKCINTKCISNINSNNSVTFQINNNTSKEDIIIENIKIKPIIQICKEFLNSINLKNYSLVKIAKNICIITFVDHSNYTTALNLNDTIFDNHTIHTTLFKQKENEIIFIKYNKLDLKYMYICSHCKSSWKN